MVAVFKISSKYVGITRSLATRRTLGIPKLLKCINKAQPEPLYKKTQLRSWSRSHAYENRELWSRSHFIFTRAPQPYHESTRPLRIYFDIFQVELYTNVLSVTRYRFCWIGAYSYNCVWNGGELSINTFVVLSLFCVGWTGLTSEIFCPNCFLHFAYQKCFSFYKLPNIHFWEHFLQISHNFKNNQRAD